MNAPLTLPFPAREIVYPESDGKPMADNTRQLDWITLLYGNLRIHFAERAGEVFVGANQFWYPVEGEPEIRQAPDVYVVFGRPQGHRGSYKQWVEANIPITVAFEIRSPSNDYSDLIDTLQFYEEYGVEEYLLYDPESGFFQVHLRMGKAHLLRPMRPMPTVYTSERLGIRFDTTGSELIVSYPDGRRFLTHQELEQQRAQAADAVERERRRADQLLAIAERLARGEGTAEDLAELRRLRDRSD